ncbi:unnamed protein product [Arabis nemorensis]|uniref:Uncharacterized protein n=1 Tax=Arabis nemorensis TaxID=586526 RepID=A0A565AZY5_9BRAS|nr:unnamed protein product [Arabis nemorensis]
MNGTHMNQTIKGRVKKPHSSCSGTVAFRDVPFYEKTAELLMCTLPFQRHVYDPGGNQFLHEVHQMQKVGEEENHLRRHRSPSYDIEP